jgi:hypothetical protein
MMRSAEKGELYEQLPQAAQSHPENLAPMASGDTISTIADSLEPDSDNA